MNNGKNLNTLFKFRRKKFLFLAMLMKNDFDYKIDIVNFNTKDELLHNEILHNSIKI